MIDLTLDGAAALHDGFEPALGDGLRQGADPFQLGSVGVFPLWVLIATTRMRRGEALGLRWSDVVLDAGRARVVQTLGPGSLGWQAWEPPHPSRPRAACPRRARFARPPRSPARCSFRRFPAFLASVTTIDDALAHTATADVVVTDYRLGTGDGVQLTRALVDGHPNLAVVMLTASIDESILAAALEAGCSGFVTKAEPLETVIAAVRGAAVGEAVITPSLLLRLLPRLSSRPGGRNPDLTDREQEVLALVTRGMTNQQIAEELGVALDTARNHVRSILAKLGVHSKLQAAAAAVQRGLVPTPTD